jgi:hypothetical protein
MSDDSKKLQALKAYFGPDLDLWEGPGTPGGYAGVASDSFPEMVANLGCAFQILNGVAPKVDDGGWLSSAYNKIALNLGSLKDNPDVDVDELLVKSAEPSNLQALVIHSYVSAMIAAALSTEET